MVAGNGEAEHGGGTGATPLEERVRRLEKDVEELREQVRTHAQAWAGAEVQNEARVVTPGVPEASTAERPKQWEPITSPFAEATRNPVRRGGGDDRARGSFFGLFPEGLPSATWWVARAGVVLLLVGVSFLLRMGVEQGWLTAAVRLNAEWLALLGVMGGYATPFMLLTPDSNVPALVAYSLLLLCGYLMVYVLRGWRPVYITAIFGIWAILTVSDLGRRNYTPSIEGVLPTAAAWSVSTGALTAWPTILFLPSARRYLLAD